MDFNIESNIVGDGYLFSFYFGHEGEGVVGKYGLSEGTLADDQIQMFYENGCEVRVGTVAAALELEALKAQTLYVYGQKVNTNLYKINFKILGQNGVIYSGEGENYLLCIDQEGEFIEITEEYETAINKTLAPEGLKVRKILKGGKIIVEKDGKEFDIQGRSVEIQP